MPDLLKPVIDAFGPLVPARWRSDTPVVPVIRLNGVIGAAVPLRQGLGLTGLAKTLQKAFDTRGARAVALLINSPGGSPAQSHLIYQRIRQLSLEKNIPVIAFVEDIGASGGYMLACAADEIIADVFSMVGSIGVLGGGFGFDKLIEKLGIERRLYTSGERKAMLDPFLPEKPEDVKRLKALFSGEFWTAQNALELGLIDGIGDLRSTLRARYGDKVRTPLISGERSFLGRKLGLDIKVPGADDLVSALEERAYWSRYGL